MSESSKIATVRIDRDDLYDLEVDDEFVQLQLEPEGFMMLHEIVHGMWENRPDEMREL